MGDSDELNERMAFFEMKLAEQDRFLSELNSVVLAQEKELKTLRLEIAKFEATIAKSGIENDAIEKPPHY